VAYSMWQSSAWIIAKRIGHVLCESNVSTRVPTNCTRTTTVTNHLAQSHKLSWLSISIISTESQTFIYKKQSLET